MLTAEIPAHMTHLRPRHNAYLIYRMLGREVSFNGRSKKIVTGIVSNIHRDILNRAIEIAVNGKTYKFQEPSEILMSGGYLVFVYGNRKRPDLSDAALFQEMKASVYHENIDDIIKQTPADCKTVRFCLGRKARS
jgi:hypothetical protein